MIAHVALAKHFPLNQATRELTQHFKIAETTAGNDALVEAQEGLRDGFSVEVYFDEYETLERRHSAHFGWRIDWRCIDVRTSNRSARVESVAATKTKFQIRQPNLKHHQPTEGEDEVEDTVKDAATAETVEAAQSITATANCSWWLESKHHALKFTAAKYLENKVLAATGDENARQYVLAADDNNTTIQRGLYPHAS
jgi:hypothetical protein